MTDMELADLLKEMTVAVEYFDPDAVTKVGILWPQIIAALRRGHERYIVTDAMVDAVIRRARDGHPPAILDGNASYNVRAMLQTAMDAIGLPPSGEMVMVPREPTQEMRDAGRRALLASSGGSTTQSLDAYRAMLSAAEAEGRKS